MNREAIIFMWENFESVHSIFSSASGFTVSLNVITTTAILLYKQTSVAKEYIVVNGALLMDSVFIFAYFFNGIAKLLKGLFDTHYC